MASDGYISKSPVPSRSNLHFYFLTFGHSGAQGWAPECLNVRRPWMAKCNQLTPLPFKGLTHSCIVHFAMFNYAIHNIFEYKFNSTEDADTVFRTFNLCRHGDSRLVGVGSGQGKRTRRHHCNILLNIITDYNIKSIAQPPSKAILHVQLFELCTFIIRQTEIKTNQEKTTACFCR